MKKGIRKQVQGYIENNYVTEWEFISEMLFEFDEDDLSLDNIDEIVKMVMTERYRRHIELSNIDIDGLAQRLMGETA